MSKGEESRAMDAALPPPYDGDTNDVGTEMAQSQTVKDEEHCATDGAPPPYGVGDGDDGDDADKSAHSGITRARMVLALGLAFEVCSTLWAFFQAVSAGALLGDADCSGTGVLARLYYTSIIVDTCDEEIDADVFHNLTDAWESTSYTDWTEHVACDSLTDVPTDEHSFEARCTCDYVRPISSPCSWVALSSPPDDVCHAAHLYVNSYGTITEVTTYFVHRCWPSNPSGTIELTITALVVALSSQLLEAFVGFKYWKAAEKRTSTTPTLVASVFEAVGVVIVTSVLLSLPGFYGVSEVTYSRLPGFFWLAWTIIIVVSAGALAEMTAECSDRAARGFPYLGAVGNALVWLAAALLEIVVATYLLWVGARIKNFVELVRESAGLFALELLGLVSMWVARGLWTRAKLLMSSVKTLEGPLRKGNDPTSVE